VSSTDLAMGWFTKLCGKRLRTERLPADTPPFRVRRALVERFLHLPPIHGRPRGTTSGVDSVIPTPASGHKPPASEVPRRPFLDWWLSYQELRHRR
jgi:hypothetical protein